MNANEMCCKNKTPQQIANDLIREHEHICAAYAEVCNGLSLTQPSETMLAVKDHLEAKMVVYWMEEFGWVRTEDGQWEKEDDAAYWERLKKEGLFG